ncbi:MAG TPA: hypothetical protein VJZ26_06795 [Blastocatellia bacterium]|nr:hypothetical protein [Blastocatellia bacterium]
MTNYAENKEPIGAPLAVCVNDCAIDHGQKPSELAPICFRLGCAFAEMRWRSSIENSGETAMIIRQQINQIVMARSHR